MRRETLFNMPGFDLVHHAGMQARERIDVRTLFEGDKYNILVATSVAEEGLDIQACNMVIRYMYIKDMIAKIQSKGKALFQYSLSCRIRSSNEFTIKRGTKV